MVLVNDKEVLLDITHDPAKRNEMCRYEYAMWDKYSVSKDEAKVINYYRIEFVDTALKHLKKKYYKDSNEIKSFLIDASINTFAYSLGKGHFAFYEWLALIPEKIDIHELVTFSGRKDILFAFQKSHDADYTYEILNNDRNSAMLTYLEKHCENMYGSFMRLSEILFYHGVLRAMFDLLEQFNVPLPPKALSNLSNLPVNRNLNITPAISGSYFYGDNNLETWGFRWSIAYDKYHHDTDECIIYNRKMMTLTVEATNLGILKQNASLNLEKDIMVNEWLKHQRPQIYQQADDTPILILDYTVYQHVKGYPKLSYDSLIGIIDDIVDTFTHQLHIDMPHCVTLADAYDEFTDLANNY